MKTFLGIAAFFFMIIAVTMAQAAYWRAFVVFLVLAVAAIMAYAFLNPVRQVHRHWCNGCGRFFTCTCRRDKEANVHCHQCGGGISVDEFGGWVST